MDTQIFIAIISAATTIIISAGGWLFAWHLQKDTKRNEQNRSLIERLRAEILARIDLEDEANLWLSEMTSRTPKSIQREVRERAEARTGSRPSMSRNHKDMQPIAN